MRDVWSGRAGSRERPSQQQASDLGRDHVHHSGILHTVFAGSALYVSFSVEDNFSFISCLLHLINPHFFDFAFAFLFFDAREFRPKMTGAKTALQGETNLR